jgi:hypothetical protein
MASYAHPTKTHIFSVYTFSPNKCDLTLSSEYLCAGNALLRVSGSSQCRPSRWPKRPATPCPQRLHSISL